MQIKRLYYSVCLISALFATFTSALFADTIVLKSGKTVEGKLIEKTDKYVKIDFQGVELTYFMDEIQNIKEDEEGVSFKENRAEELADSSFQPPKEKDAPQIFKQLSLAVVYIRAGSSQGSGFVIDKKGVVVTNWHVIGASGNITVSLNNGKEYTCKEVLNYDILKDICILQLDIHDELPYIPLGEYSRIDIGQTAYVIGNPLGLKYRISDGIIAQKEEWGFRGKIIQFTCPISPGSSGSPLINTKGEAIGLVSSAIIDPLAQNLNFALSSDYVKELLLENKHLSMSHYADLNKGNLLIQQCNELVSKGEIDKAYLIYKEVFEKTCRQTGSEDYECSYLFTEMLRTSLRMVIVKSKQAYSQIITIGELQKNKEIIPEGEYKKIELYKKELFDWASENIKLIEDGGGLKKVYEKIKGIFDEDTLSLGYRILADWSIMFSYQVEKDPAAYYEFLNFYNEIKKAFPHSKNVEDLKRSAKEVGWIVK